jgi:HK97 family phage major capsid protein
VTKRDVSLPEPSFSEAQIDEAKLAIKGLRSLMHSTSIDQVPLECRKALSAFSFGSQGFLLAPEMSQTILSCLSEATDIASLMNNITISGPSIKFMVDNEVWDVAAWACDSSCFANNPTQQLGAGLGELEIKPESLRYIVCATRDLLEDSGVNIEHMLGKAARAFGAQISHAILAGDGFGKPMGILNPAAGIPICETAEGTAPGQFTWQDLVMLRWQVPMSLQGTGGAYLMNPNTGGSARRCLIRAADRS